MALHYRARLHAPRVIPQCARCRPAVLRAGQPGCALPASRAAGRAAGLRARGTARAHAARNTRSFTLYLRTIPHHLG